MDKQVENWIHEGLVWLPAHGVGYYPVNLDDHPYDDAYWAKYVAYSKTPLGERLTAFRVDLVNKYTRGEVLDFGIGCGSFVEARGLGRTRGYDINPAGVAWLQERGVYRNPWAHEGRKFDAITFWDALEHVPNPGPLLDTIERFAFVSMPIFTGSPADLPKWKHFRPDEHCWYFTRDGFVAWMRGHGFGLLEESAYESTLGREDIGTFVFRRGA